MNHELCCGLDIDFMKHLNDFHSDHRRQYDICIATLSNVIDAMEELLVLKNQYNLHVNFEEYFEVSAN